jgi:hypothetical protein
MELLILTEDRRQLKRGQVVAAMPDGHPWSERERAATFWRIVRVDGLLPVEAEALTMRHRAAPIINIDGMPAETDRAELYRRAA